MSNRLIFSPIIILFALLVVNINLVKSQPIDNVRLDVPFYSQRDEEWSELDLGSSTKHTIGSDGCGITSAAMILSYYDLDLDPESINQDFAEEGGFSGALMKWAEHQAWKNATNKTIEGVSQYWSYDEDILINNLDHGRPVVVFLNNEHYVVVTGYETIPDPEKPGQTINQFYINDPWAIDRYDGKDINIDENVLDVRTRITQMNVLHTDPVVPVTGPLVDWPVIQAKYTSLGGQEGIPGNPIGDDEIIYYFGNFDGTTSMIEVRHQEFDGGEIYAYKYPESNDWVAYWITKQFQQTYELLKHGVLHGDEYANNTFGGDFVQRVDGEKASLKYIPWEDRVEVLDASNGIYAEYFPNQDLSGEPVVTRYEKDLNFFWLDGPTHPKLPENYSVRYKENISVSVPWIRTLTVSARGGVRAYLDGERIVDEWENPNPGQIEVSRWLSAGEHEWVIEYRNTNDNPEFAAGFTEWPVKIVWAAENGLGAFEGMPISAPPLGVEFDSEVAPPPLASQVIDDLSPRFSFIGADTKWKETTLGFDGHSFWTNEGFDSSGGARWDISQLVDGYYDLFVYIPYHHATTQEILYKVVSGELENDITINQMRNSNRWIKLGRFSFEGGNKAYIQLNSPSEEDGDIAADAIAYLKVGSSSPIDELGDQWNRQIQEWFQQVEDDIKQSFDEWWASQQENLEKAFWEFIHSIEQELMEWLMNEFSEGIVQCCYGAMIPMGALMGLLIVRKRKMK